MCGVVFGGVMMIFEMFNMYLLMLDEQDLGVKFDFVCGCVWCDYVFYIGGLVVNVEWLLVFEWLFGCVGVKVFMGSLFGDLLVDDEIVLCWILCNGWWCMVVYVEDEVWLCECKVIVEVSGDVCDYLCWCDVESVLIVMWCIVGLVV